MNAKHLTLICSASCLLLANYLLLPAWSKHQRLEMASKQAKHELQGLQVRVNTAQSLPVRAMQLSDRAVALSSAVNAWTSASRDYGITLTQIATPTSSSGQNVVDITSLGEIDSLTSLPVQRISLKGQYRSLNDFKRYLSQEMNADQAVAVEQMKLTGDTFELLLGIYSSPQ
jgi:hypothetical protein